jgi:6-phosphogluconate dehydrogenase (decarboxylating)
MRRRRYRKSQNSGEVARHIFASARISSQPKHYARIVAVMMPREKWTDERLDDLNKKVDDGFARLDGGIKELRREMNARFDSANDSVNTRFDSANDSVNARFDALNRNLMSGFFVLLAAIIGSNVL